MISHRIALCGTECAVVEWNPSAKISVFALHGWLDNLATFEKIAQQLTNIRIIAFDFPGHGHSDHIPAGAAYHFLDGVCLIEDIRNAFDLSTINLLGHSMGGATALLYAAARPEHVNKLISIESLGPLTAKPPESLALLQRSVHLRAALSHKTKPRYSTFAEALQARADASKIEPELIKPIVERGVIKLEDGYTWRSDSRLRVPSASRLADDQLTQILHNISADLAVIEGSNGFFQQQDAAAERRERLKINQHFVLTGGHHLHLEQPEDCAKIIQAFLSD